MLPGELRKIKIEFTGPSVQAVCDKIPTAKIFKTADCSSFVFYYNFNWQLPYQTPMSAFDEIEDYD